MMKQKKKTKRTEESVQSQSPELDAEQVPSSVSDDSTLSPKGKAMTVNFESLAKAEQLKSVADYERYQNLLRDLAAGKKRDDAEILAICERVDRNVAMLEEDVKWRKRRDELIAVVRTEKEIEAEQKNIDSELTTLRLAFEKVEAEYEKKRWPLRAKYDQTKQQLHEIWMYRNELERDCRDPNLFDELEKLDAKRQGLGSTRYWEDKAENIRLRIVYKKQEIDQMPAFCPGG